MAKKTSAQIDEEMSLREETLLTEEEKKFRDWGLLHVGPEAARKMTNFDAITIVRGYESYVPRMEETNKAFKLVADWRQRVGHEKFLTDRLPQDEEFHNIWEERVYGEDRFGHMIVGMRVGPIDADALEKIDEELLMRLQGQKMTTLTQYKYVRAHGKPMRYKHVLIADLKGVGLSIVSGKKRAIMQRMMTETADVFPESVTKIYMVNTPMIFRALWAVVKPWVHPITQAKINMCGSESAAQKMFEEHGIPLDQLPTWIGGKQEGAPVIDLIKGFTSGSIQPVHDPLKNPPPEVWEAMKQAAEQGLPPQNANPSLAEISSAGDEAVAESEGAGAGAGDDSEAATPQGGALGRTHSLAANGQPYAQEHVTPV